MTCTFFLKSLRYDEKTVYNCYQGLSKVWRDLRKLYLRNLKKVHVTHFHKKIKDCHENYKKPLTCTFFLKSLRDDEKMLYQKKHIKHIQDCICAYK